MNDEIIAKLLKTIEETNKRTIEEANLSQTKDIKEHIDKEITELKTTFELELKKRTEDYETKYIELKANYNKLEKELRKNNIIIFGLETPAENLPNYIIETLKRLLQIEISINDINNVYVFGKQTNKKPVILKLTSYLKKLEILRNSKKLKGTTISITEELSLEERQENKILRQHLKQARAKNLNAIIKNKKLIINGQEYTAKQLSAEEEDSDEETYENNTGKNQQNSEIVHTTNQISKANSAPSTPKETRKRYKGTEEIEREEEFVDVFETEKVNDSNKRKVANINEPASKLRSSSRINGVEKVKLGSQTKTPKK